MSISEAVHCPAVSHISQEKYFCACDNNKLLSQLVQSQILVYRAVWMDTEGIGQKNPETRQVAAKAPMRERGHLFLNVQHG